MCAARLLLEMVHQRVHEHIHVLSNALFLTAHGRFSSCGSLWDRLEMASSNPGEIRAAAPEPLPLVWAAQATVEQNLKRGARISEETANCCWQHCVPLSSVTPL